MGLFLCWKRDFLILILLGIANFSPILARAAFKKRLSFPVDFDVRLGESGPLFGPHKTWRGLFSSVVATGMAAYFTPVGALVGMKLAVFSMAGDLLPSFIKRRSGFTSGKKVLFLDQVPESLLPLVLLKADLAISWMDIVVIVLLFYLGDVSLSPILFRFHIRRNPH